MAIYITGDTHGDFQRFGSKYFPQQKEMIWEDYVVIAGDFGGLWDGSQKDQYWLDWLNKKPFTTLFVDGNHENFDLLNTLPEKEWNGGRVHVVREHILHLMRGQVFDFGGLTWFTMGGAASHDIQDGILDPADPDFEHRYWLMRRMRSMFRVKGKLVGRRNAQPSRISRSPGKLGTGQLDGRLCSHPLRSQRCGAEDQSILWNG